MTRARTTRALVLGLVVLLVGALVPAAPAGAAVVTVTGRVSTGNAKTGGYGQTAIAANGRLVAFNSGEALVAGDTGLGADVFLRDRVAGTTERVSVTDDEQEVGGTSTLCAMTDDGRYVAFVAQAANLAGGVLPRELYLRDRKLGTTEMVSISSLGAAGNGNTEAACAISDDGRYVVFETYATNLGSAPSPGAQQIYRRDRLAGATALVSKSTADVVGVGASFGPTISADGKYVGFWSLAENLVANDTNDSADSFVREMVGGTTSRVSLTSAGDQLAGLTGLAVVSGDGRYVSFASSAPFVSGDTNDKLDVFVRDRNTNQTERVSLTSADGQINGVSNSPTISDDGRWVAFQSSGAGVVPGHPATSNAIFLRDRSLGTTIRISQSTAGTNASGSSEFPSVADDGSAVAFASIASNLVPGDTNSTSDVFVRDLKVDLKPFASFDAHIKQQYVDFVGRQPTAGELNLWRVALTGGDSTADQMIDTLAHGTVWSGRRAPVIRLYWSFFKRVPDVGGLDYWTGRLAAGKSIQWVAAQFALSNEFKTTYGSLSNSAFVTLVYQNIFDRDPDAGGLSFWTSQLNAGTRTRGDVMANFSESSEGKRVLEPVAGPILVHLGMLRTMPPLASVNLWAGLIRAGSLVIEDVIRGIRVGVAYDNRIP